MFDRHQIIEEPCEGKLSCTVLKTSETVTSLAEFNQEQSDLCLVGEILPGKSAGKTRKGKK
jgi:hypothetical protein